MNTLVRQMLDVIDARYSDFVTLQTLSTDVGRQPAYLGRLFRDETGSGVRQYLTRVRLKRAAELIRDGVKIEAVSLLVGYRSKKNFYQQFRRQFGTTPVGFRASPESAPAAMGDAAVTPAGAAAADTSGAVAAIVRASNRALRDAVRAQETMLQQFSRMRLGILVTDAAGRYIGANTIAADVTGYSTTELCERSPADLFLVGLAAETRCACQLLMPRPTSTHRSPNAIIRTKTGEMVRLRLATVRNLCWADRQLSAMLERIEDAAAECDQAAAS